MPHSFIITLVNGCMSLRGRHQIPRDGRLGWCRMGPQQGGGASGAGVGARNVVRIRFTAGSLCRESVSALTYVSMHGLENNTLLCVLDSK